MLNQQASASIKEMASISPVSPSESLGVTVDDHEVNIADGMSLSVLDLNVDFMYTIPSFSTIHVSLRQATIQVDMADGCGKLLDAFIHSHHSLPNRPSTTPFCISLSKHCFVPVSLTVRTY